MQNSTKMKDLPESEKPYEKCLKKGAESLSDAELIAAVIRTGSQNEQALEVAKKILMLPPGGILNLEYLTAVQLQKLYGIGAVKAVQLKCVAEISKRIAMTSRRSSVMLNNASSIAAYYMECMRHETKEKLLLSMFDSNSKLIGDQTISVGTCNASLISPREVFLQALDRQAVYVVLLHNHPSGNPNPSEEDILVTKRIKECGKLLDVPLMDHIIVGDNCYYSFHENGIL